MGSFSPWIMRVGQLISGSSSTQMLPDGADSRAYRKQLEGKNL